MVGEDNNTPSNPDVGVDMDFEPQLETGLPSRALFPHIFPANKAAWHRFRGPLPQLGSMLQLIKPPRQ